MTGFVAVVVFSVLLTYIVPPATAAFSDCQGGTDVDDGCSSSLILEGYREIFDLSCNAHDFCYQCGIKWGISRLDCDRRFYTNMGRQCNSCRGVRRSIYLGVRWFGGSSYASRVQDIRFPGCERDWVQACVST